MTAPSWLHSGSVRSARVSLQLLCTPLAGQVQRGNPGAPPPPNRSDSPHPPLPTARLPSLCSSGAHVCLQVVPHPPIRAQWSVGLQLPREPGCQANAPCGPSCSPFISNYKMRAAESPALKNLPSLAGTLRPARSLLEPVKSCSGWRGLLSCSTARWAEHSLKQTWPLVFQTLESFSFVGGSSSLSNMV